MKTHLGSSGGLKGWICGSDCALRRAQRRRDTCLRHTMSAVLHETHNWVAKLIWPEPSSFWSFVQQWTTMRHLEVLSLKQREIFPQALWKGSRKDLSSYSSDCTKNIWLSFLLLNNCCVYRKCSLIRKLVRFVSSFVLTSFYLCALLSGQVQNWYRRLCCSITCNLTLWRVCPLRDGREAPIPPSGLHKWAEKTRGGKAQWRKQRREFYLLLLPPPRRSSLVWGCLRLRPPAQIRLDSLCVSLHFLADFPSPAHSHHTCPLEEREVTGVTTTVAEHQQNGKSRPSWNCAGRVLVCFR